MARNTLPSPSPITSCPSPKSSNALGHLTCSRGRDHLLQNPTLLPCLHRFCADCLKEEVTAKQDRSLLRQEINGSQPSSPTTEEPSCPVPGCNERIGICIHGNGDVSNLPSNVSLQSMLDCHNFQKRLVAGEELCGDCPKKCRQVAVAACIDDDHFDIQALCPECLERHKTASNSRDHVVVHIDSLKQNLSTSTDQALKYLYPKAPICHFHPDQRIRMYCPEHSTVVCLVCACTANDERGHERCRGKFDVNTPVAHRHIQEEFDTEVRHLGVLHEEFELAINNTNVVKRRLLERSDAVEGQINDRFEELKRRLEQRRGELIEQTREICRLKTEALDQHLKMLNDNNNIIKESLDFIHEFRQANIQANLFFVKEQIERRVRSLRHQFRCYTRGADMQPLVHPDPLIYNDAIHYNTDTVDIEQFMGTVFSSPCLNNFKLLLEPRPSKTILRLACRDIYGTRLLGELPVLQVIILPHGTETDCDELNLISTRRKKIKKRNDVHGFVRSDSRNGTYSIHSRNTLVGRYNLYVSYPHPPPFFDYGNQGKVFSVDF